MEPSISAELHENAIAKLQISPSTRVRDRLKSRRVKEDRVMKRLLLFAAPLIVFLSSTCFGDATQLFFGPNYGDGGNFGLLESGPGYYVAVGGGTPWEFYNDFYPIDPGSTMFGGTVDVYMDGGVAVLGGIAHDLDLSVGSLFVSSVTLPTNGKDFTATVQLYFTDFGTTNDTLEPISIAGSQTGTITFYYYGGYYSGGDFTVAPEPTTFVLLGTGLAGIGWRKYRPGSARI
jgi:hypothetical protein